MAGFGNPGGKCAQTADRDSSLAAFGPWKKAADRSSSMATHLYQNESGHKTADLGSFMATFYCFQVTNVNSESGWVQLVM